jgi:hypothetical protein
MNSIRAAIAFGAALAVGLPATAADAPAPIRPYYDFVHWFSMGRQDLALAQFADDAVVIAGPHCTEAAPCVGHDAIRTRYFGALMSGRAALPLTGQQFDGRRLRTRGAASGDAVFEGQRVRWQAGHVFEFRADRIAVLRVEWQFVTPPPLQEVAAPQK